MKEVLKALRPVRERLRRNRLVRGAAAGLAAGFGAAALLQAVSFFVPVPDRCLLAAAICAAVTVLTALGNALRPVKNREAAEAADACGLQERAVTALEGGEEPIRRRQRRDACDALERLDVKKILPGSMKKALLAALGCAAVLGILLLVPSPQDSAAAANKALNRTLKEGREAIARAAEEDEASLDEERKSELRKITADLNRELNESRDAAEAMVALDRAEQRLEQMRQQTAGDAAAAADSAAGKNGNGKGENGQQSGSADGNAAAEASAQAGSGQQSASSAAASLTDAQMKTLEALAALKGAVNPSAQQGAAAMALAGMQGGTEGGNGNGSAGVGGQTNGKAGAGAGEGSTNLDESGGEPTHSSSIVKGNRDPKYKVGEYETIYDPERVDKARQDVMTEQDRLNNEDSMQIETGPGQGNLSGDVPWSEALQDYADTEARAADRENLTKQEREWVDEYYRLLTEQK